MKVFDLRKERINLNGIDLSYKIAGEGKPLLILHGWGAGSLSWTKVVGDLASNGLKVIIFDLPGFGETNPPESAWSVGDYSKLVDDFIEKLNIKNLSVLGHSFGGAIVMKMQNIDGKIILCDAAIIREDRLTFRQKVSRSFSIVGKKIISKNSFAYKFFEKMAYFISGTSDYYSANPLMKEIFKKVVSEDLSSWASKIKNPTLIIWGDKDKVTPLKDAYFLNENIENSELVLIKDCGHNPHRTNSGELSKIIINYLSR